MNRRGFFARLAGAVAATAVAPVVLDAVKAADFPSASGWQVLTTFDGPVRDLITVNDRLIALVGDSIYEVFPDGTHKPLTWSGERLA